MELTVKQVKEILDNSHWEVIDNKTKKKTHYSFSEEIFYINNQTFSIYDIKPFGSNQFQIALIDWPGLIIRIAKITKKELIIIDYTEQFLAFHIVE